MKFDLHVHSTHSGDSIMSAKDIAMRAVEVGFDGFALTDHNTTSGNREAARQAKSAGLAFIPGIEVSTQEGHLLGLGIKSTIKAWIPAEEAVAKIHDQGGLAIAAHPYDFTRHGMGDVLRGLDIDAIEVINGKTFLGNGHARKVAAELGLPVTAGSDAHTKAEMGSAWTECSRDVLGDIQKGKTTAHGGTSLAAFTGRIYRRLRGVPLFPNV